MCLVVALFQQRADLPLVVAANRDELLARPAQLMTVLQEAEPRILGGRDLSGGGTWAAVNAHGLVVALTNRPPPPGGFHADRRSRGALPLALSQHASAREAVDAFTSAVRCRDYNGCWLFVADRTHAFVLEVADAHDRPRCTPLGPGAFVLENAPLEAETAKQRRVGSALEAAGAADRAVLPSRLQAVLADHTLADPDSPFAPLSAACVHAGDYGTRSVLVVEVGDGLPRVAAGEGSACTAALEDFSALWAATTAE